MFKKQKGRRSNIKIYIFSVDILHTIKDLTLTMTLCVKAEYVEKKN